MAYKNPVLTQSWGPYSPPSRLGLQLSADAQEQHKNTVSTRDSSLIITQTPAIFRLGQLI